MKKRRLKKGCWYIIIPFLAMAAIALFYLFTYLINEAGNACTKNAPAPPAKTIKKKPEEPKPTAQQIAFDNNLKEEINRFLHSPLRLDTGEIAVSVFNLSTNRAVFAYRDSMRLPPASCLKIATAVAALETLGMDSRLYSSLQIRGDMKGD
ncbi:MAG: D-alanyl-D-alanine carboxypeptidase, partial [Bacteroidaceae bacterium]|nr:D-alanyl-D-alanine carboxypeptidase [Bacteroidaceae bacterium]